MVTTQKESLGLVRHVRNQGTRDLSGYDREECTSVDVGRAGVCMMCVSNTEEFEDGVGHCG